MTDFFDRVEIELRGAVARRSGLHQPRRARLGALAAALGVMLALGVGTVALVARPHRDASGASAGGARQLVAELAVLRRPQTAADRVNPGKWFAQGSPRVWARSTVIPGLTRVVTRGRDRVVLFVVHLTTHSPNGQPTVRDRGYLLYAKLPGIAAPVQIGDAAAVSSGEAQRFQFANARIAIVPDGVARVQWTLPTRLSTATLTYIRGYSAAAVVDDNIANRRQATASDALYTTWYAADGRVVRRIQNMSVNPEFVGGFYRSEPAPETALSRRAEHDPSTPNQVLVVPSTGSIHTVFTTVFRVLVNRATYAMSLISTPHPGCAINKGRIGYPQRPSLRGEVFNYVLNNQFRLKCTGTYRIAFSVIGPHHGTYPPFGSATFTVR